MSAAENMVGDRPSLVKKFANKYSIDPKVLLATLKATCFRQSSGDVSDEQMVALLVVADQYSLNPFTKEIYAYPDSHKGIVPVVSIDGWVRIINEHPDYDGYDVILPTEMIKSEKGEHPPAWPWISIQMHRKNVAHTPILTEYFDECYKPPYKPRGKDYFVDSPWQTHPKRFLRHKALIQAARVVFGFAGIYDDDEAQRILQSDASVVSTQTPRTEGTKATDVAKENLKRQLTQSKGETLETRVVAGEPANLQSGGMAGAIAGEPANLQSTAMGKIDPDHAIARELADQRRLEESRLKQQPKVSYRFDTASALIHIRAAKDLAALKKAWNEVSDDYDFSDREMPIDVEAIYRDLRENFEMQGDRT